jgi:hypothetical protein
MSTEDSMDLDHALSEILQDALVPIGADERSE